MMARGLPRTANCQKIIDELQQRKLFCKDAVNIIKKKKKIETDKGGNTEIKETVKKHCLYLCLFLIANKTFRPFLALTESREQQSK
jgi:hypothetical protein